VLPDLDLKAEFGFKQCDDEFGIEHRDVDFKKARAFTWIE
jgi:hypothetical protein